MLDLGCGPGNNGIQLKELHPALEIHGIDLLEPARVSPCVIYQTCDLEESKLPYADQFFDAVVFTHVIEHLKNPLPLGREINRVMRRGASVYVETPNWTTMLVPSFGFKRHQHDPFNFFDDQSHVKPWSKQGLFAFLEQTCRLKVCRVGTVRNWLRVPFDLPAIVAGLILGRRSLIIAAFWNLYGWCIYAVASKE